MIDLTQGRNLHSLLNRHGVKAKKGLGQHFLSSKSVVDSIVNEAHGLAGILEIGPGPGVLTGPLSEACDKLLALEVDEAMPTLLAESAPAAEIVLGDALKVNVSQLLGQLPEPRGIISNLPYYITGALLQLVAEHAQCIDRAILMMQKEVAERVMAGPKTPARGSLSIYLQATFSIKKVCSAPASCFSPPPKVDSEVLAFYPTRKPYPKELARLVRVGFAHPRKTLENNLRVGYHAERENVQSWIAAAGLPATARAQELTFEEWLTLSQLVIHDA